MSCIITYKGQKYSEEQFKEYFINNKQEFATSIAKNKDVIDSFKRKMEGIDGVFNQSPELASIGSKAQYLQYLSTIFKTSKVKDIVYHGSKNISFNEKYIKDEFGRFIFSTKDKEYADIYSKRSTGRTFQVINNIKNPFNVSELLKNKNSPIANRFKEFLRLNQGNGYDPSDYLEADANSLTDLVPLTNRPFLRKFYKQEGFDSLYGWNEIAVFEPEQIHILGSKQDIEGFKEFASNLVQRVNLDKPTTLFNIFANVSDADVLELINECN